MFFQVYNCPRTGAPAHVGRPHGPSAAAVTPERPFIGDTTAGRCYGIRAVQDLPGHSDAKTTMGRSHIPNRGPSR